MSQLVPGARLVWCDSNLIAASMDFLASSWGGSFCDVVAGYADPYGRHRAYRLTDTSAGATGNRQHIVTLTQSQVAFAVSVQQGTGMPDTICQMYDNDAATSRGRMYVTGWVAGKPTVIGTSGATILAVEEQGDDWWRIKALTDNTIVPGNVNRMYLYPDTTAGTGYTYFHAPQVVDGLTIGGYVPTYGTAKLGAGVVGYHDLRVPLQQTLPAGSVWVNRVDPATRVRGSYRLSPGPGAQELVGELRYIEAPQEVNDLLRAGIAGHPLVYIPDTSDMDDAYECDLIQPTEIWTQEQDVDWPVFREQRVPIRLRCRSQRTYAGLF